MLAITDHWHVTRFEHEGVLVLPSAELSGRIEGELDEADVLAYGIDELYGSSGPEIHDLRLAGDGVQVRCSPVRSVALRSGRWDGCKVNAERLGMNWRGRVTERDADGAIVAARLERPEFHSWGRVEIEAADGGRAWSGVVYGNG